MTDSTLAHELLHQLLPLLLSIGCILIALHFATKITGIGGNVVKRLVDALLEAFVSVLIFPFKLLTWLLKKLVP